MTPRLGQEMDRFYKMLESVKNLKTPTAAPGEGALSRIFGKAAQPQLDQGETDAGQTNYAEEDVIDAEEYEEYETGRTVGNGYADEEEDSASSY